MKVLLLTAVVCVLRSAWEREASVGRLSFVSRLRQYETGVVTNRDQ